MKLRSGLSFYIRRFSDVRCEVESGRLVAQVKLIASWALLNMTRVEVLDNHTLTNTTNVVPI